MTPRRFVFTALAACLALATSSCTTPSAVTGQDEPTLSWSLRNTGGDDQPVGAASLRVNGQTHLISQGQAGHYRVLDAADYANWGVPASAATATMIWWAGGGEVLYATCQNGATRVYRKILEEGMRGARFKLIRTIQ